MTKPAKPYTPQAGGLPARVCAYFQANPSEELSVIDIAYKFNVNSQGVQACLNAAVDAQLLVRVRNADLEWVYGPGKAIDTLELPASQELTPTAPAPIWPTASPLPSVKPLPKPTGHPLAGLPVLSALPIDDDVPIPTSQGARSVKETYANGVLSQLQPGQSIKLPLSIKYVLANAVTARHKAKSGRFTTRNDKDTQTLRVWRVS